MRISRFVLAGLLVVLAAGYVLAAPGQWLGGPCAEHGLLSLACFEVQRGALADWVAMHPLAAAAGYFVIYVVLTAVSIPGAAVMTLVGGALFGLAGGVVLVSFASAIGATLAFLSARFILRDWVEARFGQRLAAVNRGIQREGASYLFALRLVPVFPFFVINLVMGITAIRTTTFYIASQLGMLPGTLVYVNAGTQLGQVHSIGGIVSPGLIASFVLLGVFPLIARRALALYRRRRALAGYTRPKRFDRNLIVIGGGSGGLVCALIAATVKARVTLVEAGEMGGDCLNTGCIPSKALLASARAAQVMRRADRYGLTPMVPQVDFKAVMARVKKVVATIAPHDSRARFESLGVDVRQGHARLLDPWTVAFEDGSRLTARAIVLATGAEPIVPEIPGLAAADPLTSNTLWSLTQLPARLAVIGGGPIGCEMGQAFTRLGADVVLIEQDDQILPREDADVAAALSDTLRAEGLRLATDSRVTQVSPAADGGWALSCRSGAGAVSTLVVDRILVAVGRRARTTDMGLEALGIAHDGVIAVDTCLATHVPTVYACGDAIGGYQLTHAGSHEAWHATVNALFGMFKSFAVRYDSLPWAVYTEPNVAHVGHNERSATAAGLAYEVTHYSLAAHDRAVAESATTGFVKILTVPGKDRVLGAAIVGEHAAEWIGEYVVAMRHGLGLNKLLSTIHSYPTFAEANRFAAGEWKKRHAPAWVFPWLARFHAWRRR
ncbi:FAD-dependent oxidoreductase [Salinisphaera sp. Q1T1-3]|uniref:FAD-dependent oxidoreductase n=1 Tax=Salinisphaera sp. Q1T1-3 TaxID=2321229 RepID=UPI000E74FBE9|nr:bifunctional TVP38/TMEM64 family protein/FAD-dependent oxidoreductase [Salinisphaera sp. Q1T1-3]RJS93989.1 pyridine nucleotide-disulfide oxidoreductase [Salinisphaera sp. Q1T1-3]